MKKVLISLILLAVMILPCIAVSPVSADKYASSIGVAQVTDNNVDVTYTGKTWVDNKGNNKYEYIARISQAPIYNDDGSLVDCSWHYTSGLKGGIGTYSIINNVFSATVTGSAISTTYHGQTMSWNPVVYVDSTEYKALGEVKVLAVDPINENYRNNTLEWDYQVCIRRVRVIEGLIQETWIFDKDPRGTVWIKDNAQKSAGFTWAIAPYAYDAKNTPITINQYKQVMASDMAKATYPVTIDPTEVYVTSASDGYVYKVDAVFATSWGAAAGDSVGDTTDNFYIANYQSTTYRIYRSFLFFDSSALPDSCTITSANVSIRKYTATTTKDFFITVQNGQPTYPHDPLALGDFDKTNYSGYGGNLSVGVNSANLSATGFSNLSMTATGLTWISTTGTTKLCLRASTDIVGTAPTGDGEYARFWAYEKGAGYRPYLEVTYSSSGAPTVTTNPATYVTKTTAQLNGYLNVDGGEACTVWFNYSVNGSGTYNVTANQTGKVTGDSFFASLSGLTANTLYNFSAVAWNSLGQVNGSWLQFNTTVTLGAPTNVLCNALADSISLSWTKGGNTSYTYIRYKVGSYPTSSTDGNAVANQSGVNYMHTGLASGTSYYYRLWGEDGGILSTTNVTTMCTTTASGISSTTAPLPTLNTSGYTTVPNGSALTNNPLYPLGNLEAAAISVPQGTWWMLVGMGGLVVTGLFIYTRSRNLLAALGAMIIFGVVMANMGIFPIWVMYVFGLAGIGMSWKELR